MELRIAGLVNDSIVDGPGIRYTVFVQGCPHHCEGCHNPQTWDFGGGRIEDTDSVLEKIAANPLLDGVTFSGGEPFCQCKPLAELAEKVKALGLNIMAYTGYEYEYLTAHADEQNGYAELLERLDYLVDGRFVLAKKSYELKFMGSSNQRFIDVQQSLRQGRAVLARDPWDDIEIKIV